MPTTATCPSCGKICTVADDLAGRRIRCPYCQLAFFAEQPVADTGLGVQASRPVPRSLVPPLDDLDYDLPLHTPHRRSRVWWILGLSLLLIPLVCGGMLFLGFHLLGAQFHALIDPPKAPRQVVNAAAPQPIPRIERPLRVQKQDKQAEEFALLMNDLQGEDQLRRHQAVERFGRMKPTPPRRDEIATLLGERLKDKHTPTNEAAARALKLWATPAAVPALLESLDHQKKEIRWAVLDALGRVKDERAVEPVAKRLLNAEDRFQAGVCLQKIGPAAEPEALKYLDHEDRMVRMEACRVLKGVGTQEGARALTALQGRERDSAVRAVAKDALQSISKR